MVEKSLPTGPTGEPLSGERRFELLVNSVHDYAIYMLDTNGFVTSWNPGAQRFKGYSESEIIGRHFSCFYTEEDRQAGRPQRALASARNEGRFEAEGWRVRKDGTRFWANVVIDSIRDEQGVLQGFAKITRDITERKQAQEALEEARAALAQAQKMEAVGQLTGGIAHDFNNLLQAIGGSLETIERRLADGRTDIAPFVDTARAAVERASGLTRRLLTFSRRHPLTPARLDLNALVMGMRDLVAGSVGEGIRLDFALAPGLWPVWADANQLENALLNLAINARDAMPGGGCLTVTTANVRLDNAAADSTQTPGDYVRLSVTDTGVGMAPEVAERAFEPFFTTKPIGQGTGLGLSQLYGFAQQSGGHARITSAVGAGTTVTLLLPRHAGAAAMEGADAAAARASGAPAAPARVLVVEDDALVRMVLVEGLTERGHRVLEAVDGQSALAILSSSEPLDLLTTDVGLPGVNGRQVAETARALRPNLKVLFLTGYADKGGIDSEAADPDTRLLGKPVAVDTFVSVVEEMLRGTAQG